MLIDTELRSGGPDPDYGATATLDGIGTLIPLLASDTTIWGVPADPIHDGERITPYEAAHNNGTPQTPTGTRSSSLTPVPFMLNPTLCGVQREVGFEVSPYALPDLHSTMSAPMGPGSGCGLLEFKPDLSIVPTTSQAETGSGLDANLNLPNRRVGTPQPARRG